MILCAWLASFSGCSRYSDEEHERNVLNGMLVHEDYGALEKALAKAERQYRSKRITASQWEGRWESLADINADGVSARFDAWVAQTDGGYAHLARGMYRRDQAWEVRGTKFSSETPRTQLTEFRRLVESAEEDLLVARRVLPGCTVCAAGLISVSSELGRPPNERDQLLEEALVIDATAPMAISAYFRSLYPQWGGSYEQMAIFITYVQRRSPDPDIAARLESVFCWEQARLAEDRKNEPAAFEWYQRGVTRHPYGMLMKNLAEGYTERGRHEKAAEILEQNLRINDPWDLYTIEALAQAYFHSGQQDRGEAMMRRRDEALWRYDNFE